MRNVAKNAIIMAAGVGSRLSPLTNITHKSLLEVNGEVIIETLIEALIENGIYEIHIVVGHLKEQFNYLIEKYKTANIHTIFNPYYERCNNISSLYIACNHLGNSIITDADMIIKNPKILNPHFDNSGYCSAWVEGETNEWLQTVDKEGNVLSCSRTGGSRGWQLFSISFWSHEHGQMLKRHLEDIFKNKKITDIYWDDIPMFYYSHEYQLKIRKINHDDLIEIDNLHELLAIDDKYRTVQAANIQRRRAEVCDGEPFIV